ncbi:hypothetical protein POM88_004616 [Heracleum sosnowskyi]|uniref:Transposase n=1 Tax=Heracleum sosnowskyi TaxID=360622 RepID=A0AAD8JLU4_9APIA|nr:hypothetical protein POM88_004616 [Heracleum sosnowskyi]
MAQMLSLKSDHHWSEACYDQTSQFFKGILPQDNSLIDSFYSTKKYMEELGLPSEQIDCCVNGCMPYWGEDKTAGHLACPHCAHDHDAYNLSHGGKTTWFDNHRKFLPANHPFRKNKNWFTKGKTVTEVAPPVRTCEDVFQEIESLGLMKITELGSDEHNAKARLRRVRTPTENIPANSGQGVRAPTGQRVLTQSGKRVLTQPGLAPPHRVPSQSGQRSPSQSGQQAPTQSAQRVLTYSRQQVHPRSEQGTGESFPAQSQLRLHSPAQSGQSTPNQSHHLTAQSQQAPTQSAQRVPTYSRQQVHPHFEQGTGENVRAQSQSRLHSPAQSGQSTPNQSQRLTAQSRQHTPEAQSRRQTSVAQSEPI